MYGLNHVLTSKIAELLFKKVVLKDIQVKKLQILFLKILKEKERNKKKSFASFWNCLLRQ